MKISAIVTASLVAATAALSVTAASADIIDRRQHNQQVRIEQGLRSGQITRQEYYRLQAQQAHIAHLERRAERDGRIDHYERAQIRHAQNQASRSIFFEKHDRDSRWNRWNRRWW